MSFDDVLARYPGAVLLKKGGQKVVYHVQDPSYGDAVLKVGVYGSPSEASRIEREVELLRRICSPYYPRQFEFHRLTNSRFTILEEFVPSIPLTNLLGHFRDPRKALMLVRELVIGLDILWRNENTVHRDLKPDNILIRPNGQPIIIDLGIARQLDLDSLTRTLAMMGPGTPYYASPEQLTNSKTEIDWRCDQFNLGTILLQLLLGGAHPFDPQLVGSGASIMHNVLSERWHRAAVAAGPAMVMDPLLRRMLARQPHGRFRRPEQLLAEIDRCLGAL